LISSKRLSGPRRYLAAFLAGSALLLPLVTGMVPYDANVAPASAATAPAPAAAATAPAPMANGKQIVVYYGYPRADGMGVLGTFDSPDKAAKSLAGETALVDSLNGDRGATGAMDLIYGMVSSDPGPDGIYVRYLDSATTQGYIDAATKNGQRVILDMQIGRGSVAAEVQKLAPFLKNPNVDVAIDPEYAVGPSGIPIQTSGHITGDDINQAQDYLNKFVKDNNLPPKMLVVHQYMVDTISDTGGIKQVPNVTLVLNMDGIGAPADKLSMYEKFAEQPWVQKRSYMVFLRADSQVSSEQQVLAMNPAPDMIAFQ